MFHIYKSHLTSVMYVYRCVHHSAQEDTKPVVVKETKEEVNEPLEKKKSVFATLRPLAPVFSQGLLVQWTLAFAIAMTVGYDVWTTAFGPHDYVDTIIERESCAILGLWLCTIAGYLVAFGAESRAGWMLSSFALMMVSLSAKLMADSGRSAPSFPIYSVSGFDINVPDLLVAFGLVGCAAVLSQPAAPEPDQVEEVSKVEEAANSEAKEEEVVAPQVEAEPSDDEQVTAPEPEASGPRSLIGQRMAVDRDGFAFRGTVKDYNPETREWSIRFDDELLEEEEMNRVQLTSAFKLYSKVLSDNIKAMWRAGEL